MLLFLQRQRYIKNVESSQLSGQMYLRHCISTNGLLNFNSAWTSTFLCSQTYSPPACLDHFEMAVLVLFLVASSSLSLYTPEMISPLKKIVPSQQYRGTCVRHGKRLFYIITWDSASSKMQLLSVLQ